MVEDIISPIISNLPLDANLTFASADHNSIVDVSRIMNDMKLAFDAIKSAFSIGNAFQPLATPLLATVSPKSGDGSSNGMAGGSSAGAINGLLSGVCINACGMRDLVDSLADMRDSLRMLNQSLAALQQSIMALVLIIGISIAIGTVVATVFACIKLRPVKPASAQQATSKQTNQCNNNSSSNSSVRSNWTNCLVSPGKGLDDEDFSESHHSQPSLNQSSRFDCLNQLQNNHKESNNNSTNNNSAIGNALINAYVDVNRICKLLPPKHGGGTMQQPIKAAMDEDEEQRTPPPPLPRKHWANAIGKQT